MATDILIVGSGAREHALAWKLSKSPRAGTIYVAPGNAGTETFCKNIDIPARDIVNLAKFASEHSIGLTVVGPDEPLSLGIVDLFKRSGLRIFGPSKAAAQIESSKLFTKKLLQAARIPTAAYRSFTDPGPAREYTGAGTFPVVVKADGLASGKGVYICNDQSEVDVALDEIMVKKIHGDAGNTVVIEEFLKGLEISIHALSDGVNYALFPASQDNKRVGEGDTGRNTGGMGVTSPVSWVSAETMFQIENTIVRPILHELGNMGMPFQGVLFPGIIITPTGPKVIELNARFGDPECQVYMRMLENDLMDLLDDCVDGGIGAHPLRWASTSAVSITLASGGYPDEFTTGYVITGITAAEQNSNVVVFHAGTAHREGLRTAGGRVLSVSATGSPISRALELAYKAADEIMFEHKYMRRDIGIKEIR